MKIVLEVDDEEVRRLFLPLLAAPAAPALPAATRLLTVREVAERLGISRTKAYELIYRGQIPALAIGRARRVSSTALTEFISKPTEHRLEPNQRRLDANPKEFSPPSPMPSSHLNQKAQRTKARNVPPTIDLMPKSVGPDRHGFTDDECEQVLGAMKEHGWPEDVIEQVRADRRDGLFRTYLLKIGDAARYLGISRYALEKLISAGRLRLSTIASPYRNEKPERLVPAKDVLALK